MNRKGTLYLVATPLGNLEDLSLRAQRVLKEVECIAAEDTRHTLKLLNHCGIKNRLVSFYEQNEKTQTPKLVASLKEGDSIAVVSDAGMPTISDPGYRLVKACAEAGITVVPIPGPNAAISAIAASGLPTDQFYFVGFPPIKSTAKKYLFNQLKNLPATLVFYESPHRLVKTLESIQEFLGNRAVVIARELTKVYEEFMRGTVTEMLKNLNARETLKGECVLLVARDDFSWDK